MIDCITIENATFTALLQDKGVGPDEPTYDSMKTKIFKWPDGRRYRDIWKLSKLYVEKLKTSRERFPRYPTHRDDSAVVKRIGNIIFELRDHDGGVFVLDQGPIHTKFASMWGADNESGGPTMSDKARIFGLVTSEKAGRQLLLKMLDHALTETIHHSRNATFGTESKLTFTIRRLSFMTHPIGQMHQESRATQKLMQTMLSGWKCTRIGTQIFSKKLCSKKC